MTYNFLYNHEDYSQESLMFPENISILCMKFFERFCRIIINNFTESPKMNP